MRGKLCSKRSERANSLQRNELMTWETSRSPRAASQNSPRKVANARRTLGQSVCQPIQPRSRTLTATRSRFLMAGKRKPAFVGPACAKRVGGGMVLFRWSVGADIEFLFVWFGSGLIEPAMPFLDHVDQEMIAPGVLQGRDHDRHRHRF